MNVAYEMVHVNVSTMLFFTVLLKQSAYRNRADIITYRRVSLRKLAYKSLNVLLTSSIKIFQHKPAQGPLII